MHAPQSVAPTIKTRTITLTNRAPIVITEDEWEIIAQGKSEWEHPAGSDHESVSVEFHVREKKRQKHDVMFRYTGRVIVHATYHYYLDDDDQRCQKVRVGREFFTDSANELWKQMRGVADELRERIDIDGLKKHVTHALDQCFANLEAHKA